jgi:hypothetical protein
MEILNKNDLIKLAGVTFIDQLVAGLILTFIWLQILKDRRSTKG